MENLTENNMNLQQLAKKRMIDGAKNHPDQGWDKMSDKVKIKEAIEELADTWNYVDTHKQRVSIRVLLLAIWILLKK
jgi:hypothetical protein